MTKRRTIRALVAALAGTIVVVGGLWAFGGIPWLGGGDQDSQRERSKIGQLGGGGSRASPSEGVVSHPTVSPTGPTLERNPDGSYDVPNFVKVIVPEEESWGGPTCNPPRRGSLCEVTFQGSVYSKNDANIFLLAFENDSETEAVSRVIPVKSGVTRISHQLSYLIGPQTAKVTFLVVLKDPAGIRLAQNFPYTVPITG